MSWALPAGWPTTPARDFGGVRLSPRLAWVAGAIDGGPVADIGTDHGRLAAALVASGRAESVVAIDVLRRPLDRCIQTLARYGVADRVAVRQGFGLEPLSAGEVETAVMCGMGGQAIQRLLEAGHPVQRGVRRLIVQPQTNPECVRRAFSRLAYRITAEAMVPDNGRFYVMIDAVHDPRAPALTDHEIVWGPCLLAESDPLLAVLQAWRQAARRQAEDPATH